jgi:hypothetical protein
VIGEICVMEKRGGRTGEYLRNESVSRRKSKVVSRKAKVVSRKASR